VKSQSSAAMTRLRTHLADTKQDLS
jgi:hypothetical protein